MIYEITILGKVDGGDGRREVIGEVLREDMKCEGVDVVNRMFKALDLKIVKHDNAGVKPLAYDIKGEAFANYDYYEIETDHEDLGKAIEFMLMGMYGVLRYLVVKQYSKEEIEAYK